MNKKKIFKFVIICFFLIIGVALLLCRTIFRSQLVQLVCRLKSEQQAKDSLTHKLNRLRLNPKLDSIPEKTIPLYESMISKNQFYYQDFNVYYDSCIIEKKGLVLNKEEISDQQRVTDLENIRTAAIAYYNKYDEIPDNITKLVSFDLHLSYKDPEFQQPYILNRLSTTDLSYNTDIEVCINYKTKSSERYFKELEERGVAIWWDRKIHNKGNECNRIIVTSNPMKEELSQPEFAAWADYGNGLVPDKWTFNGKIPPKSVEIGFTNSDSSTPRGMALQLLPQNEAILTSDLFKVNSENQYILAVWNKTLSYCNNCAFVGVKFYDMNKNLINYANYNKCGSIKKEPLDVIAGPFGQVYMDPFLYFLIKPSQKNIFIKNEFYCIVHPDAKYAKVVFGYLKDPKVEFIFDNVTFNSETKPHVF